MCSKISSRVAARPSTFREPDLSVVVIVLNDDRVAVEGAR